jgi:hypothetical protein
MKLFWCLFGLVLQLTVAVPQEYQQTLRNLENLEAFPIRVISNLLNPQAQKATYSNHNGDQVYLISSRQPAYQETFYETQNRFRPDTLTSSSSGSCESFWSLHQDYERYGLLKIPNPDQKKSVIRVQMTVGARLPSVSSKILLLALSLEFLY